MIPSIVNIRKAIYCLNKRLDLLEGGEYSSTVTQLSNKVAALESLLDDDALNPTAAIDKFNEIVAFLNSIDNTETLLELLRDVVLLLYQQNYVTVLTYADLPTTGSADTIYRVSNYNGSTNQIDTTSYSVYVWDNSDYTLLCVKSLIGEVFDISEYHGGLTYLNLEAALDSNNGGGVPPSLQKGGMSVKFVRSSDNKYVQFRLMSDTFSITKTDWQGEDETPTAGSDNLVKSGGVHKELYFDKETTVTNTKNKAYVNQTNGNITNYPSGTWNIAIFKVIVNQRYTIHIPKSGNSLCGSVMWGDAASQTTGLVREGTIYGNEQEQNFTNIVAKKEYLFCTYDISVDNPLPIVIEQEATSVKDVINGTIDDITNLQNAIVGTQDGITRINGVISYYTITTNTSSYTLNIPGYTLNKPLRISIKFTSRFSSSLTANPTLNINSTGAKPLYYNGELASYYNSWEDGDIVNVIYDGEAYQAFKVDFGKLEKNTRFLEITNIPNTTIKYNSYINNSTKRIMNSQIWNVAKFKVDTAKTYNLHIPKSGNTVCMLVALGDSLDQSSDFVNYNNYVGNESEINLVAIKPSKEYISVTYDKSVENPLPILEEVVEVPINQVVQKNIEDIEDHETRIETLENNYVGTPKLSLLDEYTLIAGEEFDFYFNGIFTGINSSNYEFALVFENGFKGNKFKEFYTWTPSLSNVGTHNVTIEVYNDTKLVDSKLTRFKVVNPASLTTSQKVCLFIGDSLMYDSNKATIVGEVYRRLCTNDAEKDEGSIHYPAGYSKNNFTFIGINQSQDQPNAWSVGVGGWTADYYNKQSNSYDFQWITCEHSFTSADQHSVFSSADGRQWRLESIETNRVKVYKITGAYKTELLSGTLTWISGGEHHDNITITSAAVAPGNPFWIGGKVDFAAFAASQNVSAIDYVVLELGTNNVNSEDEDIVTQTKTLIDNILADYPNCKILLMTTQISAREGWYSQEGTFYNWVKFCAKLKGLYRQILEDYPNNLALSDMAAQLDSDRCGGWSYKVYGSRYRGNVPSYRGTFLNNALHPNKAGYMMIADMIIRDMVARLT